MPKPRRTPEDIAAMKSRILRAALDIICQEGFSRLSMRKIAQKSGMTAANIYNYYENKDEIYLAIQTGGFAELVRRFEAIKDRTDAGVERIRAMILAYIEFGTGNPDQYDIMFTRNTPKYSDYVGTALEPAARIEKQTALEVAAIAQQAVAEAISHPGTPEMDADYRCIQLWTALHGVVSLLNSRVLQEAVADVEPFLHTLTHEMMSRFCGGDTSSRPVAKHVSR